MLQPVDTDQLRDRWRGAAAWLDATPSELVGLVVLALGAVAVVGMLWWTGRPGPVPAATVADDPTPAATAGMPVGEDTVTLHVAGAVASPGLVEVTVGARVADALAEAGGVLLDADASALNLAREVVDGERIDVPRAGEDAGNAEGSGPAASGVRPDGTIDLNRATASELEELPGVGPVLASRIVDHRERNGPFTEVGQLRDVAGIGEKTFQAMAELVGL